MSDNQLEDVRISTKRSTNTPRKEVNLQTDPSFDDYLEKSGGFGFFQKYAFITLVLVALTPQFMLINMSFFELDP